MCLSCHSSRTPGKFETKLLYLNKFTHIFPELFSLLVALQKRFPPAPDFFFITEKQMGNKALNSQEYKNKEFQRNLNFLVFGSFPRILHLSIMCK